jgi:hypothetical protein
MTTEMKSIHKHLTPQEIASEVAASHDSFWSYLHSLGESEYEYSKEGIKWNAGQQAHHILKSCEALLKIMWMPAFLMKRQFGKANRPSRTPAELVARYDERLSQVDSRTTPFLADVQTFRGRDALLSRCKEKSDKISRKFSKFSAQKLDELILPHPLLGKVTLREMGYFFVHHVQHHHQGAFENLKSKKTE